MFFMLFHKTAVCEKCGLEVQKKEVCTVDYSRQGRIRGQQVFRLCRQCGEEELAGILRGNRQKTIVASPSEKFNAFVYYSFREYFVSSGRSMTEEELKKTEAARQFLPENGAVCSRCGRDAVYTWCTLNFFREGDPFSAEINPEEKAGAVCFCPDCLAEIFLNTLHEKHIYLRYIYPMGTPEEGIYTPWSL